MGMFDKARKAAADTWTEDIMMIDVSDLTDSPDNFFELTDIGTFAYTILGQGGIKQNLTVKPIDDGRYEIVSGHRRASAIRYLLEKGEDVSRLLPCSVQEYKDNDEKVKDIILMNASARSLTDAQLWKCYEILNEMFQRKKEMGERFGRIQTRLAETLGISTGQVAKIQGIEKNAIKEVKKAVETGDLSINTAEKIAKLDKKEQEKLASGKPLSKVKPKDIKKAKDVNESNDITEEKSITNDTKSKKSEKPEPLVIEFDDEAQAAEAVLYANMGGDGKIGSEPPSGYEDTAKHQEKLLEALHMLKKLTGGYADETLDGLMERVETRIVELFR